MRHAISPNPPTPQHQDDGSTHSSALFHLELSTRAGSVLEQPPPFDGPAARSSFPPDLQQKLSLLHSLATPTCRAQQELLSTARALCRRLGPRRSSGACGGSSNPGDQSGRPCAAPPPAAASESAARLSSRSSSSSCSADESWGVDSLADALQALGYVCETRCHPPPPCSCAASPQCLEFSRHAFLLVLGRDDGSLEHSCILDAWFREQFAVAHPSPEYAVVLSALPHEFVGSPRHLQVLVEAVWAHLRANFCQQGQAVPPWRSLRAMLGKWFDVPTAGASAGRAWREPSPSRPEARRGRRGQRAADGCESRGNPPENAASLPSCTLVCCGEDDAAYAPVYAAAASYDEDMAPASSPGAPPIPGGAAQPSQAEGEEGSSRGRRTARLARAVVFKVASVAQSAIDGRWAWGGEGSRDGSSGGASDMSASRANEGSGSGGRRGGWSSRRVVPLEAVEGGPLREEEWEAGDSSADARQSDVVAADDGGGTGAEGRDAHATAQLPCDALQSRPFKACQSPAAERGKFMHRIRNRLGLGARRTSRIP